MLDDKRARFKERRKFRIKNMRENTRIKKTNRKEGRMQRPREKEREGGEGKKKYQIIHAKKKKERENEIERKMGDTN